MEDTTNRILTDVKKMEDTTNRILTDVKAEYERARDMFPRFNSAHEGYAVIKEEFDELWDEIKRIKPDKIDRERLKKESLQIAAMALRFIKDVCENESGS